MAAILSVRKLTKEEKSEVISFVLNRDKSRCILHRDRKDVEVHELLQRSSGCKNSARVFRKKYVVCVCRDCHHRLHRTGEKRKVATMIFDTLSDKYGYSYPASVLERFSEEDSLVNLLVESRAERKRTA